jgi:long-chain acyl-CoA synthetase
VTVPERHYWTPPEDSLVHLLLDHRAAPDDPLICTIDRELSKREFIASAESIARDISSLGIGPGGALAVQQPSGPEMAAGMFGAWLAGCVFVPINAREPQRGVEHVLNVIRPAALWNSSGLEQLGDAQAFEADAAFVTWTSGTTGPPKPILQTHSGYREILARVLTTIRTASGPDRPSPNLIPVTLALNAGIHNLLFGLMASAAVVLMERFVPVDFATLVDRYGVRSTVLPPAAMTMLTDSDDVTDLAPLRYVRSITAPLSPLAARRFMAKFGITVLNGYGQTEIGEVVGWTAADAREHPDKIGAAGRPHPGVEVKVVDDEGRQVARGVPGHLLVRPPRMAAGYAGGESMADRLDAEGYVRTGDYAIIDEDDFIWIEGRSTDLIIRGGNKVFPDQVEEVLMLTPGVREVAVSGVPDARLGEVPVAFIVGDASDDELEAVCRDNLLPYKIPIAFVRVPAIPRSEVGKILRRQLSQEWEAADQSAQP